MPKTRGSAARCCCCRPVAVSDDERTVYGDRRQRAAVFRHRVHRHRQRLLQVDRTQHRGRSSPTLDPPLHGLTVQKQLEKKNHNTSRKYDYLFIRKETRNGSGEQAGIGTQKTTRVPVDRKRDYIYWIRILLLLFCAIGLEQLDEYVVSAPITT